MPRLVSVISAVHNESLHLPAMIESVQAQDYDNWELLLVDDRSNDETSSIISRFAASDARVQKVPSSGVNGKNSAWNRAYAHSNGQVVCFFAGDDIMPPGSLRKRAEAVPHDDPSHPIAAYSKVRMFGSDPRFDGVVVPRGARGSRSGGTITMNRSLADLVFPIDESLPNEDIWTSTIAGFRAREVEAPVVVVDYRIHAGNSFRRGQDFAAADAAIGARAEAYELLLRSSRFSWTAGERRTLHARAHLEQVRRDHRPLHVLRAAGVPMTDRLRAVGYASPSIYAVRTRFYSLLSGW